jgi:hypothetical protein
MKMLVKVNEILNFVINYLKLIYFFMSLDMQWETKIYRNILDNNPCFEFIIRFISFRSEK